MKNLGFVEPIYLKLLFFIENSGFLKPVYHKNYFSSRTQVLGNPITTKCRFRGINSYISTKIKVLWNQFLSFQLKLRFCGTHLPKNYGIVEPIYRKIPVFRDTYPKNAFFQQKFRLCKTRLPKNAIFVKDTGFVKPIHQKMFFHQKHRSCGTCLPKNSSLVGHAHKKKIFS